MRARMRRINMMGSRKRRSKLRRTLRIMGTLRIMIIIVGLVLQGFLIGLVHGARYLDRGKDVGDIQI